MGPGPGIDLLLFYVFYWGLTARVVSVSAVLMMVMVMTCQFHWWRKPEYPEEEEAYYGKDGLMKFTTVIM